MSIFPFDQHHPPANSVSLGRFDFSPTTHSVLGGTFANYFTATASQFGEGASGKAISTYFERLKKDPHWNLANTLAENGATPKKGGGRTPKATPSKKTSVSFRCLSYRIVTNILPTAKEAIG